MRSSSIVASVFAAAAVFGFASEAKAYAPIQGAHSYGQSYSKSSYKGDFGGSFDIAGTVVASDYDKLCSTTAKSYQCAGLSGFGGTICGMIYQPLNDMFCAKNIGNKTGLLAKGSAEADVKLFGKDLSIFDISADANADPTSISTGYGIYVGGAKISAARYGAHYAKNVQLAERTLVKASGQFMLGPIPITVQASAVGSLGIDFTVDAAAAQVSTTAEPYAEVDGVFSAGVGTSAVSVGVEGELMLARVGTPATATVKWLGGKSFSYEATLDVTLRTLDGSISLYAEGFGKKASWEITSWEGLEWSWNLGRKNGSFAF